MDYDSDSDGSDSLGLIPPTQVVGQPVGYNSYGRPSMAMNNNTSYEQDHDSSSSSEEDDSDAEEAAPPIVPRGKTFRPPVGDGDSSSSSSEDEKVGGGNNNNNASSKPIAQIVHNSNPGAPRNSPPSSGNGSHATGGTFCAWSLRTLKRRMDSIWYGNAVLLIVGQPYSFLAQA